jgi:hypothetical protein
MTMAMAVFWALVVRSTLALFRGVHVDPAVGRRKNPLCSPDRRRCFELTGFWTQDLAGSS